MFTGKESKGKKDFGELFLEFQTQAREEEKERVAMAGIPKSGTQRTWFVEVSGDNTNLKKVVEVVDFQGNSSFFDADNYDPKFSGLKHGVPSIGALTPEQEVTFSKSKPLPNARSLPFIAEKKHVGFIPNKRIASLQREPFEGGVKNELINILSVPRYAEKKKVANVANNPYVASSNSGTLSEDLLKKIKGNNIRKGRSPNLDKKSSLVYNSIRPVLLELGLWSESAEELLLGTAIVESDLVNRIERGEKSKGRGLFQINLDTAKDILNRYLKRDPELRKKVLKLMHKKPDESMIGDEYLERELVSNDRLGAALARILYKMKKEPLPKPGDVKGMAKYWKTYYNTGRGHGKKETYIKKWHGTVDK